MLTEYRGVVARVEGFAGEIAERRAADMACRAGCDGCCQVELELSPVEAGAIQAALETRPFKMRQEIAERAAHGTGGRCPMLDGAGRCSVYDARPLVCRTQGLPLRYPAGFVPAAAVGLRLGERGEATWCPLNFTQRNPEAADILDAELVDRLLAVVNQRYCAATGEDPLARVAMADLARACI